MYLCVVWGDDPTRYTAMHLNKRRYQAKSRYNSLFTLRLTITIVKELERLDLVKLKSGYLFKDNEELTVAHILIIHRSINQTDLLLTVDVIINL